MFLQRKEAALASKIDKLLAGEAIELPAGLLEEKVWQVLRTLEQSEQKSKSEHESVLTLMSDISHQLKTPLSSLTLHLDLASDRAHSEDERAAFMGECKKQTEKIAFLTDSLFKMARLESGLIAVRKTSSNLANTLRDAVLSIQAQAEIKGLTLELNAPDSLIVPHDPVWTKEAVVNILDNAIKYTAVGEISVTAEQGAIYTRVDISDTGIGLAPEEYTRIFTRFYRVRGVETQRVEGTGLGLTIAREIMRQQSGNITVSSESGKGSTFSLFLQN